MLFKLGYSAILKPKVNMSEEPVIIHPPIEIFPDEKYCSNYGPDVDHYNECDFLDGKEYDTRCCLFFEPLEYDDNAPVKCLQCKILLWKNEYGEEESKYLEKGLKSKIKSEQEINKLLQKDK